MIKIIEINKHLSQVQAKNSLLNACVIENEKNLLLIDSLLLPHDIKDLYEYCKSKNKPVKYIINTHWHSDHCYGNRYFDSDHPIIVAHQNFYTTLKNEKNVIAPQKANIINKSKLRFPQITFSHRIDIPEFDLMIRHAPGHSSDSTRIYSSKYDIYWTGDNVLNSNDKRIAIPYFYWGDGQDLLAELVDLYQLKPKTIIPGHGAICDYKKIENDIIYLTKLLIKFSKNNNQDIPLRMCYPSQESDVFWVEKMHTLNLEKLAKLKTNNTAD